ncbi:MAG TPA: S4 domain-containing protein, partial [Longimicrobiales bacterium]|nr:S4 domain-containing protein [Longimicrobiales bacterium]
EEIEGLDEATRSEPHRRAAQKALAEDVTRRVHGEDGLSRAQQATEALFGGELEGLGADEIADIFSDVPSTRASREAFEGEGKSLVELLDETGLTSSRGDARRSIEGGGIYLNNRRVVDVGEAVGVGRAIEGRFLVLRKGKKRYHLVELGDRA